MNVGNNTVQEVLGRLEAELHDPSKADYYPAFKLLMEFIKNPTRYSMGDISNITEACRKNALGNSSQITEIIFIPPVQLNTPTPGDDCEQPIMYF